MNVYLDRPRKTKKAVKEAVAEGKEVSVYGMNIGGACEVTDGRHALVGPEPYVRKWYAEVEVKNGLITKIK